MYIGKLFPKTCSLMSVVHCDNNQVHCYKNRVESASRESDTR